MFSRLSKEAAEKMFWKSQFGLKHAHCRADVIFSTRRTQEKCREENEELQVLSTTTILGNLFTNLVVWTCL